MKRYETHTKLTDLMGFLTFALFVVCLLLVLLTGGKVYRNLVERDEEAFAARTAWQYLTNRVRQAETICLEDFGGCQALVIPEEAEGRACVTRIYCHDGWLRELFTAEGGTFAPEEGEQILPLQGLSFAWEDSLLQARVLLAEDDELELTLYIRAGQEVGP